MAMTAWSAKVLDELDLLVGEGLDLGPPDTKITPKTVRPPGASGQPGPSGTSTCLLISPNCTRGQPVTSGMWITCRSSSGPPGRRILAPPHRIRAAGTLEEPRRSPRRSAAARSISPSSLKMKLHVGTTEPVAFSHERLEHRLEVEGRATDDLQHFAGGGLLLEGLGEVAIPRLELLEERKFCSSASVRSLFRTSSSWKRRTFSMAMTAWSANIFSSSICLGPRTASRRRVRRRRWPRRRPFAQHRHRRGCFGSPRRASREVRRDYSGSLAMSGMCTTRPVQDRRGR